MGITPLTARLLCNRGYTDPASAELFFGNDERVWHDPMLMADMTPAVRRVLEAGMFAAAWNVPRTNFDELYERLISWGVTEFTEDHHCSMGLNY
jgi:hypothetical protein